MQSNKKHILIEKKKNKIANKLNTNKNKTKQNKTK